MPTPINIQGSGVHLNENNVMINDSGEMLVSVTGSIISQGFNTFEIYRFSTGSPFTTQTFSGLSNSFIIENLGSNLIYYNFNGSVNIDAESSAKLFTGDSISFDLRIGSIMIQSSGATNTEVQVISIR